RPVPVPGEDGELRPGELDRRRQAGRIDLDRRVDLGAVARPGDLREEAQARAVAHIVPAEAEAELERAGGGGPVRRDIMIGNRPDRLELDAACGNSVAIDDRTLQPAVAIRVAEAGPEGPPSHPPRTE